MSDVPVVWGGVHPTLLPEQTLKNPLVDIVVEGEGEMTFFRLVETLDKRGDLSNTKGIWYKDSGTLRKNKPEDSFLDLNKLPPLPYDLIDFSSYSRFAVQNYGNVFLLESGRGCLYRQCIFCYNSAFNKDNWRIMSAEKIIENIEHLRNHTGLDGVTFVDDNFFGSFQRTVKLIELMRKQKFNIRWACEGAVEDLKIMGKEMLRDLQEVGLRWISIGVETGSERFLKRIKKRILVQEVIELNRELNGFEIIPKYNFMCGFISEAKDDLKKTTGLILELVRGNPRAVIQTFNIAVPYPRTQYYDHCLQYGLLEPQDLKDWALFNPDDWIDYCPWLNRKEKSLLKTLYVSSLFIDNKSYLHVSKRSAYYLLIRFIYKIYHRIAELRFSRCFCRFAIETKLFYILKRLFMN
jgi:radical SAM superfamily enzyme YgiQ (UPF0313 family)